MGPTENVDQNHKREQRQHFDRRQVPAPSLSSSSSSCVMNPSLFSPYDVDHQLPFSSSTPQPIHPTEASPSLPSSFTNIPSAFEVESYNMSSPRLSALPANGLNNDDDDELFANSNSKDPNATRGVWDFSLNRSSSNYGYKNTALLHSHDHASHQSERHASQGNFALTRWTNFLSHKYQDLRCWFMRKRQDWQDGRLLPQFGSQSTSTSIDYSYWDNEQQQQYHHQNQQQHDGPTHYKGILQKAAVTGWAFTILIVLIGILLRLDQVRENDFY